MVHGEYNIALREYNPKDPFDLRGNDMFDRNSPTNSNSRTVRVTEIPLNFDADTLYAAFGTYGSVKDIRLHTKGIWQHAFVEFNSSEVVDMFYDS